MLNTFLLIHIFILSFYFQDADDELLSIEVYYESLCPDCQNFVTLQLYPTWKKLGKYFNPDLKPFGKAEVI